MLHAVCLSGKLRYAEMAALLRCTGAHTDTGILPDLAEDSQWETKLYSYCATVAHVDMAVPLVRSRSA
jgi:hypothetical protein